MLVLRAGMLAFTEAISPVTQVPMLAPSIKAIAEGRPIRFSDAKAITTPIEAELD